MGVKDLWQVLAPVCERKSLWELEGQTVAVDLSCWICDSQNVAENSCQPNMHLRNLFFRTSCLLLLGARPVFVLEGVAPDLKLDTMSQRNIARGHSSTSSQRSGKRKNYRSVQRQCRDMLKYMGVSCIESFGEAEALCALLNEKGCVDGCITQDSDCFLYGGRLVYRNFTISASGGTGGPSFSVDVYDMNQIEKVLGLTRKKLIGLSLLCGCDYNQGGVSGVGKESAVKFITSLKDDEIFPRFESWRNDNKWNQLEKERTLGLCDRCGHYGKERLHSKSGCGECGTNKSCFENSACEALSPKEPEEYKRLVNELNIRRKALQDQDFPSQNIIDEYLCCKGEFPKNFSCEWFQPNLMAFIKFADMKLKWDERYALEKFLPLLTRWIILWKPKSRSECPVYPKRIIKTRVLKGVSSYEVEWGDNAGLFTTIKSEDDSDNLWVTIEPQELFQRAFPVLSQAFKDTQLAAKEAKKRGKKQTKKKILAACDKCGKEMHDKKQVCMCKFLKTTVSLVEKGKSLEEMLDDLILYKDQNKDVIKEGGNVELKSSVNDMVTSLKNSGRVDMGKCPSSEISESFGQNGGLISCIAEEPHLPFINRPEEKFSFEDLLQGERCSAADLVCLKDLNLSDVVDSITSKKLYNLENGRQGQRMIFSDDRVDRDEQNITFREGASEMTYDHLAANKRSVLPSPVMNTNEQKGDLFSSPELHPSSSSSDEEYPYTPLMERIQSLRERRVCDSRRSSTLPPLQARRFSECFDSFCGGIERDSSPIYSQGMRMKNSFSEDNEKQG